MSWDVNKPLDEQPKLGWRILSGILIVAGFAMLAGVAVGAFS